MEIQSPAQVHRRRRRVSFGCDHRRQGQPVRHHPRLRQILRRHRLRDHPMSRAKPMLGRILTTVLLALALAPAAGATGKFKVLHNFGSGTDGKGHSGAPILDSHGNLYGATAGGGEYGNGTVYELTPQANGTWNETILHNFTAGSDGG